MKVSEELLEAARQLRTEAWDDQELFNAVSDWLMSESLRAAEFERLNKSTQHDILALEGNLYAHALRVARAVVRA